MEYSAKSEMIFYKAIQLMISLIIHIFTGAVLVIVSYFLLYKKMPYLYIEKMDSSLLEYFLLLLPFLLLPMAVAILVRRNYKSLFNPVLCALDICIGIAMFYTLKLTELVQDKMLDFYIFAGLIIVADILINSSEIVLRVQKIRQVEDAKLRRRQIRIGIEKSASSILENVGTYMLAGIIGLCIINYICLNDYYSEIHSENHSAVESSATVSGFDLDYADSENSLRQNIDKVEKLRSDKRFKSISYEERIESLEAVIRIEKNYWGINEEIRLIVEDLKALNKNKSGYYDNSTKTIHLDKQMVEDGDAYQSLYVLLHEFYHRVEHSLVDIYLTANEDTKNSRLLMYAKEYYLEMKNYVSGSEDYEKYKDQLLEKHARNYGSKNVLYYYEDIDELQGTYEKYQGKYLSEEEDEGII